MSAAWFSLKWRFVDIRGRHVCNFKGISIAKKKTHKNSNPFNLVPLKIRAWSKKKKKNISRGRQQLRLGKVLDCIISYLEIFFKFLAPKCLEENSPRNQILYMRFSKNSHQMVVYISRAFQHLLKKYMDFDHVSNLSDLFILTVPCWLQILYVGRSQ